MSVALYRKYRPKTFSEVSGQNHIKVTLQNELSSGRVAHAYLFCGPRGTGKTTLARLLAKAVNCTKRHENGEPCNNCDSCHELMEAKSLDVIEIDAASHTGVDNVRDNIIDNARFTPTSRAFKVFIIDEVHMLSISAFNALLKILEEPPAHIIFILATTEVHKVPSTIISRCQRFDFRKIVLPELVERLGHLCVLEGVTCEETVLKLIAKYSGGCVRDAESLLEQVISLSGKNITMAQAELIVPRHNFDVLYVLFEFLLKKQMREAIAYVNQLAGEGVDMQRFIDDFVEFVRKFLLYKISQDEAWLLAEIDDSVGQKARELLKNTSIEQLANIIKKFLQAKETFKNNFLSQLSCEMAIVELTQVGFVNTNSFTPIAPMKSKEPEQPKVEAPVTPVEGKKESEVPPVTEEAKPASIVIDRSLPVFNALLSVWPSIMDSLRSDYYKLYLSLRMGKPLFCDNASLCVGFMYDLHRKTCDTPEYRKVIREKIKQVLGQELDILFKIEQNLNSAEFFSSKVAGSANAEKKPD